MSQRRTYAAVVVVVSLAGMAACGDGSGGEPQGSAPATDATDVVSTEATTAPAEPTATKVTTTDATTTDVTTTDVTTTDATTTEAPEVDDVARVDPAVADPAVAVCESMGEFGTDGGIDRLMALYAPSIVVTDAMTGEEHSGIEAVAGYFSRVARDFGVVESECGGLVQAGDWVAGTYALLAADGPLSQGIAAMHVTDGLVDRHINHYTTVSGRFEMPTDNGTGVLAIGENYCAAWIERDAEAMTRFLVEEPQLHTNREFVGVEQAVAFMTGLPYEIHTCGAPITTANWDAMETIMSDEERDLERTMLHVLELDKTDSGRISQHWFYFDGP